jgi:hypothetical protein
MAPMAPMAPTAPTAPPADGEGCADKYAMHGSAAQRSQMAASLRPNAPVFRPTPSPTSSLSHTNGRGYPYPSTPTSSVMSNSPMSSPVPDFGQASLLPPDGPPQLEPRALEEAIKRATSASELLYLHELNGRIFDPQHTTDIWVGLGRQRDTSSRMHASRIVLLLRRTRMLVSRFGTKQLAVMIMGVAKCQLNPGSIDLVSEVMAAQRHAGGTGHRGQSHPWLPPHCFPPLARAPGSRPIASRP